MEARDPEFGRLYPTLWAFLTLSGFGGHARKVGTLLIHCEDGKVKACLNDKEEGNYCFVSSDSVKGLLEALEVGLKGGKLDWRVSKPFKR